MDKETKLLLIDDQMDYVQPMSFWFKAKGYAVTVATNAEDALKALQENTPEIIFLDIIMPGIDGPAMLKIIRKVNETVPVVMMSSYIEDKREDKKVDPYGVSGTFFKGDDFSNALTLIESILKTGSK